MLIVLGTTAGCASTAASAAPEKAPTVRVEAPALRQGDVTLRSSTEADLPPARMVAVSEACRGERLTLDPELSACACSEREYRLSEGVPTARAGDWCGLPHPNESARASVTLSAERTELAPGEATNVVVRVTNDGREPAVYRVPNRHLSARLVQANGQPLRDAAHASGPSNDEALFELAPGGSMELRVPVGGTYSRWVGEGDDARAEPAKLSPGTYAIRVSLGGLGGEGSRLLPVQVR